MRHLQSWLGSVLALSCIFPHTAANAADDALGYQNTPLIPGTTWHVHDGNRPQPTVITPVASFSDGATAPSDAVVLFDGCA